VVFARPWRLRRRFEEPVAWRANPPAFRNFPPAEAGRGLDLVDNLPESGFGSYEAILGGGESIVESLCRLSIGSGHGLTSRSTSVRTFGASSRSRFPSAFRARR
jgi:hypothetical protein